MAILTIVMPRELELRLEQRAREQGQAPTEYALGLLERELGRTDLEWRDRLDRIVAEFRAGVVEAGAAGEDVSPAAIEAAVTAAAEEARAARLARRR